MGIQLILLTPDISDSFLSALIRCWKMFPLLKTVGIVSIDLPSGRCKQIVCMSRDDYWTIINADDFYFYFYLFFDSVLLNCIWKQRKWSWVRKIKSVQYDLSLVLRQKNIQLCASVKFIRSQAGMHCERESLCL